MAGTTSQTEAEQANTSNNKNISKNKIYNPSLLDRILLSFKQVAFDMRWLLLLLLCVFLPSLFPTDGHHLTASLSSLNILEEHTEEACIDQENYILDDENCIEVLPEASDIFTAIQDCKAVHNFTTTEKHFLAEVSLSPNPFWDLEPLKQEGEIELTARIINLPISNKLSEPVALEQPLTKPKENQVLAEQNIINEVAIQLSEKQTSTTRPIETTQAAKLTSLDAGTTSKANSKVAPLQKTNLVIKKAHKKEVKPTKNLMATLQNLQKESYTHGKMYFLVFGAKWCTPCKMMEETAFKDEYVKDYIKAHYLKMKVDIDTSNGKNLKSKYQVKSIPTILIFNEDGSEVARFEEGLPGSRLLRILEQYNSEEYHSLTLINQKRQKQQRVVKNILNDISLGTSLEK